MDTVHSPIRVIHSCASKSGYYYLLEVVERLLLSHLGFSADYKLLAADSYLQTGSDTIQLYSDSFLSDLDQRQLLADIDRSISHLLIWVHDSPAVIDVAISPAVKRLYLVRDGRAAVNALLHASVHTAITALHPEYKYHQIEEAYNDLALFALYVQRWSDHVRAYYARSEPYLMVRLEDITTHQGIDGRPVEEIARVTDYLGLGDVTAEDIADIVEVLQYEKLQRMDGYQYRSGDPQDWRRYFGSDHIALFKRITEGLLIELGYEQDESW